MTVELDTSGAVDLGAERKRLEKDLAVAEKELAGTTAKLGNEAFLAKAPDAVVDKIRGRQQVAQEEIASAETVSPEIRRRRTFAILGWILAFALAIWLLGFPLAVPVMTLVYLKLGAGESGRVSVIYAVVTGVVFYGLFVEIVRIPFEPGVLTALLPT